MLYPLSYERWCPDSLRHVAPRPCGADTITRNDGNKIGRAMTYSERTWPSEVTCRPTSGACTKALKGASQSPALHPASRRCCPIPPGHQVSVRRGAGTEDGSRLDHSAGGGAQRCAPHLNWDALPIPQGQQHRRTEHDKRRLDEQRHRADPVTPVAYIARVTRYADPSGTRCSRRTGRFPAAPRPPSPSRPAGTAARQMR